MPPRDADEEEARRLLEEAGIERAMEQLAGGQPTPEPSARERARPIADDAIASLGDVGLPREAAPRPSAAQVIGEAGGPDGGRHRGEIREPWSAQPGARPQPGGATFARQGPAQPPPGELQMPPGAEEPAPRPGTRRHYAATGDFALAAHDDPPTPADAAGPPPGSQHAGRQLPTLADLAERRSPMERAAVAPPSAPMGADAVVRGQPAPMESGATSLGDPAEDRAIASLATGAPDENADPLDQPGASAMKPATKPRPGDPQIPGEAELSAARGRDIGHQILGRLGNFLSRSSRPIRSEETEVRAEQQRMLGEKRQMRGEERQAEQASMTRAMQERAQAQRGEQAAERTSLERARLALQERQATRAEAMTEAQVARMMQQAQTSASERQHTEDMRSTSSDEARRAQAQLGGMLDTVRDQSRVAPIRAQLETMSAEDVRRLQTSGPQWLRDLFGRNGSGAGSGGGGGAAGSVPRATWGTVEDPLYQAAVEAGTDPRVAQVTTADPTMRRQLGRTLSGADVRTARQDEVQEAGTRLPGYERAPGARRLSRQEATQAYNLTTADAEFNGAIGLLERELGQLSTAERAAGALRQGSQRYQTIQHALDVMRTQFRQINNMGNSLGSQQIVEHQFPDLSQGVTADAILANARAARAVKHAYVTAVLESAGYRPAAGGGGHGGGGHGAPRPQAGEPDAAPTTPPPAPAGERVLLVLPDGRRVRAPASQVEAAIARGARRAE